MLAAEMSARTVLPNPILRTNNGPTSWTPWAWFIVTIILASAVLFDRLGALPIEVWDEARLANNALEMAKSGLSLITTYDGIPDHWNTKPPLLIWLMSISIRLFGSNEWGVRLPSAMAALATVAIVFAFCRFRLKRPFVGFGAILVLFAGNGYVKTHAARSGDYDALLALWTTGYLLAGYMYMHAPPSKRQLWILLCTLGIVLAFLTKTAQGLIFIPALLIYAVMQGRIFEMLRSPVVYLTGTTALLICAGYYFAREQIDPGYFAAAKANGLIGRYSTVIEGHLEGPWFYVAYFPLIAISLLFGCYQFWRGRGERRQISVFLGLMSLFYLVIISSGATKLYWYAVPLLPLMAVIIAVGLDESLEWMMAHGRGFSTTINRIFAPLCVLAGFGVIAENVYILNRREAYALAHDLTSVFLRGSVMQYESPKKFIVIQQGFVAANSDYYGPTSFYVKVLREAGHSIEIQPPSAVIPAGFDAAVMCGAPVHDAMTARIALKPIVIDGECGIYRFAAR
jgi:4-amino-4-deoxy-L-arabinose transferase-like glycosyltransferase